MVPASTSVLTVPSEHLHVLLIASGVLMLLGPWGLQLVWLIAVLAVGIAASVGDRRRTHPP